MRLFGGHGRRQLRDNSSRFGSDDPNWPILLTPVGRQTAGSGAPVYPPLVRLSPTLTLLPSLLPSPDDSSEQIRTGDQKLSEVPPLPHDIIS